MQLKKQLANIVSQTIVILTRMIAGLSRKSNRLIAICPQNARHLAGNALHFALFMKAQNVDFIIFVKNRRVYKDLRQQFQHRVNYSYSARGIYNFGKAKTVVITHGLQDLYPFKIIKPNQVLINIWHAIAMKNIGAKAKNASNLQAIKTLAKLTDGFIVSSKEEKMIIGESLFLENSKIYVTGLPKNDFLINTKAPKKSEVFKIIYAPTFRDDGGDTLLFPFEDFDNEALNQFLEEKNITILLRHHINQNNPSQRKILSKNIVEAHAAIYPDPQELLLQSDALITDYSGIVFDYLLLNRPVMFFPYDLEKYSIERSFPFIYKEVTPGPKIFSQKDFLDHLKSLVETKDNYIDHRIEVRDRLHQYQDGKANERLLSLIYNVD